MKKILVTGFDPFGGEKTNPAFEAVRLLPDTILDAQVIKLEIPTSFERSAQLLEQTLIAERPDVVLCVGQAGGRAAMTVERVAINLADARIPDNDNQQPIDVPLRDDGAPAYFATLPVKAMVEAMRAAGIPAFVSYTAGTFVCNSIMYHLLYLLNRDLPQTLGGFVHVPYAPSQGIDKPLSTPTMPIETIAAALTAGLEAALTNEGEHFGSMGTLD